MNSKNQISFSEEFGFFKPEETPCRHPELVSFFEENPGIAAEMARRNSLLTKSGLSRVFTGKRDISIRMAIILEMETEGALTAEILCPKYAHLIHYLRGNKKQES